MTDTGLIGRGAVDADQWERVFRDGFLPLLTPAQIDLLRGALERDDPTLVQEHTTLGPGYDDDDYTECRGACLLCWAHWKSERLVSQRGVRVAFRQVARLIEKRLGGAVAKPATVLMGAWDGIDRTVIRPRLIALIDAYRQGA